MVHLGSPNEGNEGLEQGKIVVSYPPIYPSAQPFQVLANPFSFHILRHPQYD
jgi:hypothetical protein